MCIIAVSKRGVKQPSLEQLRNMFDNNPHGAGYMYARDGKVTIHKGFMNWEDFIRSVKLEHFTKEDPVVYHFRISTQAGVNPRMTHPFPLTENPNMTEKLDVICNIGIAHNGIIRMTSDPKEKRFSDTAIFITKYMPWLIRDCEDITDPAVKDMIEDLTHSKWALMNNTGKIETVGQFFKKDGILFSNLTYNKATLVKTYSKYPISTYCYDDYSYGSYGIYDD